VFFVYLL